MLRATVAAATLRRGGGTLNLEQDHDPTQLLLFETRETCRIEGSSRGAFSML